MKIDMSLSSLNLSPTVELEPPYKAQYKQIIAISYYWLSQLRDIWEIV